MTRDDMMAHYRKLREDREDLGPVPPRRRICKNCIQFDAENRYCMKIERDVDSRHTCDKFEEN